MSPAAHNESNGTAASGLLCSVGRCLSKRRFASAFSQIQRQCDLKIEVLRHRFLKCSWNFVVSFQDADAFRLVRSDRPCGWESCRNNDAVLPTSQPKLSLQKTRNTSAAEGVPIPRANGPRL